MNTLFVEVAGKIETLDVVSWFTGFGQTLWRGPGRSFAMRDERGTFYHDGESRSTQGTPAAIVGEVWS